MREQRQESKRIMSCQWNFRLKWGYNKDLCCHLFLQLWWILFTELAREGVLSELLYADDSPDE